MARVGVTHVKVIAHELALILAAGLKRLRGHLAEPGTVRELERSVTTKIAPVFHNHSWGDDLSHGARVELVDLVLSSAVGSGLECILLELRVPCEMGESILVAPIVSSLK